MISSRTRLAAIALLLLLLALTACRGQEIRTASGDMTPSPQATLNPSPSPSPETPSPSPSPSPKERPTLKWQAKEGSVTLTAYVRPGDPRAGETVVFEWTIRDEEGRMIWSGLDHGDCPGGCVLDQPSLECKSPTSPQPSPTPVQKTQSFEHVYQKSASYRVLVSVWGDSCTSDIFSISIEETLVVN